MKFSATSSSLVCPTYSPQRSSSQILSIYVFLSVRKTKFHTHGSKQNGSSGDVQDLYSEMPYPNLGRGTNWPEISYIFLSPFGQTPEQCHYKLGHNCFLSRVFQFTSRRHTLQPQLLISLLKKQQTDNTNSHPWHALPELSLISSINRLIK